MQPHIAAFGVAPFLFLELLFVFFAIGNYFLAKRLGRNRVLWVVLTLIPGVNYIFYAYVTYRVVFAVLDRLALIGEKMGATAA